MKVRLTSLQQLYVLRQHTFSGSVTNNSYFLDLTGIYWVWQSLCVACNIRRAFDAKFSLAMVLDECDCQSLVSRLNSRSSSLMYRPKRVVSSGIDEKRSNRSDDRKRQKRTREFRRCWRESKPVRHVTFLSPKTFPISTSLALKFKANLGPVSRKPRKLFGPGKL